MANAVCVVSTLACFEQIDEIAQLQRRIDKYRRRIFEKSIEKIRFSKTKKIYKDIYIYHILYVLLISEEQVIGKRNNQVQEEHREAKENWAKVADKLFK